MSPGLERKAKKLTKSRRLHLAAIYTYFVKDHNKWGPRGAIYEDMIDSWVGTDCKWGHLSWKQRSPHMSKQDTLQVMVNLFNKMQGCNHYSGHIISRKAPGTQPGQQFRIR